MTDNPAATNDVAVSLRARINTSQPHTARIWNYWLGGKDNYEVDRAAGDQIRRLHPGIGEYARADRLFLGRAVRHLVEEAGIRQFLDVGTGLPTADNTHEVAQRIAPESRIVYVDNDPLVLAHARALLTSTPEGRTDYLDEDLRNVDAILEHASKTLDFSEPVALILLGVVIFIGADDEAYGLVRALMDRLPAGSHLVLSHTVTHPSMPDVDEAVKFWNEHGTPKLTQRTPEDVARFFEGLQLLEPGVVSCSRWRPEHDNGAEPEEVAMFGGVARKG
ncbi:MULTISPECIES: SAM-dependent methyltransferase [unclassified Streptomyces]|uniref:SAM-dependent methyltransferase n=1 Tax=unclassified Streptomyces TaxID=2593676 RepID=UPI000DB92869|nr:SAM-dependent methyltransferase [Streptomyces sp. PsTaAH-130]MYU05883.1 SAM-dependent methyltransferase [Streptomyces sp. SID8366]MYU66211.1 SAM-dependent methyltransferase [Streptomyces sp. SID69]RAJ63942.1 S-adenosyl methyltransferase [Streptomyces sp. PsTaAH-130]